MLQSKKDMLSCYHSLRVSGGDTDSHCGDKPPRVGH